MSKNQPNGPWASAMIDVGAVNPRIPSQPSWRQLASMAGLATKTVIDAANGDDNDAAVALNQHINSMGQDFASYSNYQGTQPDGGKGAVAIRTSLYDKAENEQWGMSGHASSTRCSTKSPDSGSVDSRDASPPRRSTPGRSTRQRPALTATRSDRSGTHASPATQSAAAHSCSREPSLTT